MADLGAGPLLLGALAGCLSVLAIRELLGASTLFSDWLRSAIEPLRRARGEGYLPTSAERFRLGLLGGMAAVAIGFYLGGPMVAIPMAAAGPVLAGWTIRRSRVRFRRAVERSLPDVARAIADSLSAGHSPRGALAAASVSLEGPASGEFERVRHSLELGHSTVDAVRALADRFLSVRVDAFATALVSQRTAGGDLAALLRRFADGAAERDRVAEDARSATAQARFTGYLVAAMPVGAALFTELIAPGFIGSLLSSPAAVAMVGLASLLQVGGFVLISKLAKVGGVLNPAVLILLGLTVALVIAAGRDLLAGSDELQLPSESEEPRPTPAAAISLGLPGRLRRAGKEDRVTARSILLAKALSGGSGLMFGLMLSPVAPGRLGPIVLAGFALGGFFVPDLLLERAARARHRRMIASLPDALDLLSVSVATGKSLGAAFVELGRSARGPLADELAKAGEDMAWGSGQAAALRALRARVAGKEIASLCATLERSRKLGSPLADQLRRQSAGLRQDQRRAIEEEAARAAPKIQLVIALILVPSVLLLIVAALVANSDKLLGAGL